MKSRKSVGYDESAQRTRNHAGIELSYVLKQPVSPSKIEAYKHAMFESLLSRAAHASARRFNIVSSRHRGPKRSAAEGVAQKMAIDGNLVRLVQMQVCLTRVGIVIL